MQVTGENCDVKPIVRFSEAKLVDSLFDNLRRCGYDRPTPVQKYSIPIVLSGRDLMACAQTGSGEALVVFGHPLGSIWYMQKICYCFTRRDLRARGIVELSLKADIKPCPGGG